MNVRSCLNSVRIACRYLQVHCLQAVLFASSALLMQTLRTCSRMGSSCGQWTGRMSLCRPPGGGAASWCGGAPATSSPMCEYSSVLHGALYTVLSCTVHCTMQCAPYCTVRCTVQQCRRPRSTYPPKCKYSRVLYGSQYDMLCYAHYGFRTCSARVFGSGYNTLK